MQGPKILSKLILYFLRVEFNMNPSWNRQMKQGHIIDWVHARKAHVPISLRFFKESVKIRYADSALCKNPSKYCITLIVKSDHKITILKCVHNKVVKWWHHKNYFSEMGFCLVVLNDPNEKGSHSEKCLFGAPNSCDIWAAEVQICSIKTPLLF